MPAPSPANPLPLSALPFPTYYPSPDDLRAGDESPRILSFVLLWDPSHALPRREPPSLHSYHSDLPLCIDHWHRRVHASCYSLSRRHIHSPATACYKALPYRKNSCTGSAASCCH